jgi:hypothetical protein
VRLGAVTSQEESGSSLKMHHTQEKRNRHKREEQRAVKVPHENKFCYKATAVNIKLFFLSLILLSHAVATIDTAKTHTWVPGSALCRILVRARALSHQAY